MEWEREEARRRYRMCRVGFSFISLGIGLLFINSVVFLAWFFSNRPEGIRSLIESSWWEWAVGAPITLGTLIGAYLLWGRSSDPAWQRQAGVLVLLNFVDFLTWSLRHADEFGLKISTLGHEWLIHNITEANGWVEYLLFASLAVEVAQRLGKSDAPEAGMGARSLSSIGLVFWAITFVSLTDWTHGWPLKSVAIRPREFVLIHLGSMVISTIAAFQVTFLTVTASRYCTRALAEMDKEDRGDELLRSASEAFSNDPRDWFSDGDP